MSSTRFRQVHLDFHTSEHITDVACNFDATAFANTLSKAHVNSVTCFARCHHGWLYYPSRAHPELIHPHLVNHNLLIEQIDACHALDIAVPIYTTVQWDGRIMREHPEWLALGGDGQPIDTQQVDPPHFYHTICLNSGYRQFFIDHLNDIIDVLGPARIDGFFMDILFAVDCQCQHCVAEMTRRQIDVDSKSERLNYARLMLGEFKAEVTALLNRRVPGTSIFYNSSHIGYHTKHDFSDYSHLELESLPSGGWGYDHFPITARYARNLNMSMIGMTGKFHTYWGDFHSLKNKAALQYEVFLMLALGAGCSIGDQLHPRGELSTATYRLIGEVYQSVQAKEPYCIQATSTATVAVMNPEAFAHQGQYNAGLSDAMIGCSRMLTELAIQFDIIDHEMDFSAYQLIILPDIIYDQPSLHQKLLDFLARGGNIIGSHQSCLPDAGASDIYPLNVVGRSGFDREFILPNDVIGRHLAPEPHVMYLPGMNVNCKAEDVLMAKYQPYFNRQGDMFCSHQHAPADKQSLYPAVVGNAASAYIAFPIFEIYRKNAAYWCKAIVSDLIDCYMPQRHVVHSGPSTLQTFVLCDAENRRDIIHLLHYITEKRSADIYTIEDVIPLQNIQLTYAIKQCVVQSIWQMNRGCQCDFEQFADRIKLTIPSIDGHDMLVINY